jgi:hypothetical protein
MRFRKPTKLGAVSESWLRQDSLCWACVANTWRYFVSRARLVAPLASGTLGTLDFLRWRSDSRGKSTAVATEVSVMVEVDVTMVALVWSAQLQGARTVAPSFQGA